MATVVTTAITTAGLHNTLQDREERARIRTLKLYKRVLIGLILAAIAHIFFIFVIGPYLKLFTFNQTPTEVVQISQEELAQIKKNMRQNKFLPPVLEQEMDESARTKEKPIDAAHMGKFNQQFKEQTVAGAQRDAPKFGSGSDVNKQSEAKPEQTKPKSLSALGFGQTVPKPIKQEPSQYNSPLRNTTPGEYTPVGRDGVKLKKSDRNLLNTIESEYYSFFVRFEEPILRNWYFLVRSNERNIMREIYFKKIPVGSELPVTIEFTINRRGDFTNIEILRPSGLKSFDSVTLEAVKKLGSLPNPPEGLFEGGQYFTYSLTLTLVVNQMPVSQASPGLDWN